MKKFLTRAILNFFIVIVLMTVTLLYAYYFSYRENRVPHIKYSAFHKGMGENDTIGLVLGSSHTFYGIDSKLLNGNVFNFASTSQSLMEDFSILKHIKNPIERTFIANAANATITTYLNSDKANLFGAELEFLLDFARINKSLSDFSFGFNTSLMKTQVDVKPVTVNPDGSVVNSIETHKSRELQGASKWLINSDLKYQFNFNKNWSNTVSLVYSVFGKRIYAIGTGGLDHIYELPVQQLDLVWNSKLSNHFDLKFSADNILNPDRKFEQGNDGTSVITEASNVTSNYKRGVGFSLNLSYTF